MVRYLFAVMLFLSPLAQAIPPLYKEVAAHHRMPSEVLYSLALTESQVRLQNGEVRPWPWTLNVKGKPYFYDSRAKACDALTQFLASTQSIDIGLTQHNWYWQKSFFESPCAAFEPEDNLHHAARILQEGMRKHGSWVKAAGHFHRPAGGELARRYESRFVTNLEYVGAKHGS